MANKEEWKELYEYVHDKIMGYDELLSYLSS